MRRDEGAAKVHGRSGARGGRRSGAEARAGLGPFGIVLFSLGQFGWSLTTFLANNLLAYFYIPPEGGGAGFPAFVPRGAVLGVFTVVGLAAFSARLFDAVNDPLIAGLSDRSRSRFGRRRSFMALGAFPAAALAILQFFPPRPEMASANVAWLFGTSLLGTVFLTMYVMPYSALIAELGRSSRERLTLSAATSVTWALGFAAGNAVYALKEAFQGAGLGPLEAFRLSAAGLAALAFFAMLVPVFTIREPPVPKDSATVSPYRAVGSCFRDRPFRSLLGASFLYYFANTFLEIGIAYYVAVLLGRPEGEAFLLAGGIFGASFLWYPLVLRLAGRLGRKPTLGAGFGAQILVFGAIGAIRLLPGLPVAFWLGLIVLFQSAASAAFGILPTAMVADSAQARVRRSGQRVEGAYFGLNSFVMKAAVSCANLIFPSLLLLGRSRERPQGLVASAFVAAAATALGLLVLLRYDEGAVRADLAEAEASAVPAEAAEAGTSAAG